LRNDTVLGLRVLVSWDIMCWVVELIHKKHHKFQEHNAFIFTVIKNLSRTSQPSTNKVLHSLKQWDLLTPLNSTTSHGNQNTQHIQYKNLISHRVCFLNPVSKAVTYPGILFRRGFNKFSRGQWAERMGIWGQKPPSQGFRSIRKWAKWVFLLGYYGCIFHTTGNLAQLCENFGISGDPPFGTTLFKRTNSNS
jgi:hypothetical protein